MNYYITYGKDFFETSPENLSRLFEMANMSLYKRDPPIMLSNNMEGAILLQMLLQNLDGEIIKSAIGDILTNVQSRINS